MRREFLLSFPLGLCLCFATSLAQEGADRPARPVQVEPAGQAPEPRVGVALVAAARDQVGKTTIYDGSYVALKYPGGDVPLERGVCTDVVIRTLRTARGMDLQKLVHEDMKRHFAKYPKIWGHRSTDRSIDHRRVPNLKTFFRRKGYSLPVTKNAKNFRPGDLVTCTVPDNLPHIMIVSDRKSAAGVPLVIHNIGQGAREQDRLFTYPLTGHYRLPPKQ